MTKEQREELAGQLEGMLELADVGELSTSALGRAYLAGVVAGLRADEPTEGPADGRG